MEKKLTSAQQKIIDEMKAGAVIEATRLPRKGWVYRLNGKKIIASVVSGLIAAGAISENHKAFEYDRSYTIKVVVG